MAPKKEASKTFRMDEDFERWLGKTVSDLDCSLSDLIRVALLLAVPAIKEHPYLLKILSLNGLGSQQNNGK
jgi:hypothetical protein